MHCVAELIVAPPARVYGFGWVALPRLLARPVCAVLVHATVADESAAAVPAATVAVVAAAAAAASAFAVASAADPNAAFSPMAVVAAVPSYHPQLL